MKERFIHHLQVERPVATETAVEARARLAEKFPRSALRRMTHLGLMLGSTLDGVALTPADALVYATTYAETRALEEFLASFPGASPLLFQTSIHPGGIQQVLIGRQQPIGRLWPLAGRERIVEQALLAALLEPAERVVLAGGEERGTWLHEQGMASERAFAFGMMLTRQREGAVGQISLVVPPAGGSSANRPKTERPTAAEDPCPALPAFADALAEHLPLAWGGAGGKWSLAWR